MKTYEQCVRVVPVYILGTISVVAICVHDSHTIHPISLANVFHHHGLNVDIAEPPCAMDNPHGMMSWRSHQSKSTIHLASQHCVSNSLATTS